MNSTTKQDMFTRDSIVSLKVDEAKALLPEWEAEIGSDLEAQHVAQQHTTRKAAYMARLAMQAGLLKAGSGGTRGPNVMTGKDYGIAFGKKYLHGRAVSQSTVSLWLRLGILATDVKGFKWETKSHAALFARLTAEGFPTEVTKAVTAEGATIGQVIAAMKQVDQAKKEKASAASTETPATGSGTTTPATDEGAKDDEGNDAPVAPTQSSLERALGALALIQHVLPDLKGRDFQRFDRAFGKVGDEVTAARDALADMIAESEKKAGTAGSTTLGEAAQRATAKTA
jgi:hypothetical protein